jgi:hypothetical protein
MKTDIGFLAAGRDGYAVRSKIGHGDYEKHEENHAVV